MSWLEKVEKYWFECVLALILVVAIVIRFYQLGIVPHGMTWDEAAIGYNGYAVVTTRRDEWLTKLPVSFMSFGDFKAPLAIYANGIFTSMLGLELWVVRLPFAISGVVAVAGIAALVIAIVGVSNKNHKPLSVVAAALLAVSPWHIHFTRAGFESGMALTLMILGLVFLVTYLKRNTHLWWLLAAVFTLIASMYTYHSAKITVPVVAIVLCCMHGKALLSRWKNLIAALVLECVLLAPLLLDTIRGSGAERLHQTSIIALDVSVQEKVALFIQNIVAHLQLSFLVMGETQTLRHGDGQWGVLYATTALLVFIALAWLVVMIRKKHSLLQKTMRELAVFGLVIVVAGLVPAGLGFEAPHSNRALLALPGFIMLAIAGGLVTVEYLKHSSLNAVKGSKGEPDMVVQAVIGVLILLHSFFAVSYLHSYFTKFAARSAQDFTDGYLEAFEIASSYTPQIDAGEIERIYFTDVYGQPYIFALFHHGVSPIWYRGGWLNTYYQFTSVNVGDLGRERAVIVAGNDADLLDPAKANHVVRGSDGSVRFKIYVTE